MRSAFVVGIVVAATFISCGLDEPGSARSHRTIRMAALDSRPLLSHAFSMQAKETLPSARQVIKTGSLVCEVKDYQRTSAAMEQTVLAFRGYVLSATVQSDRGRRHAGSIVARVPARDFEAAIDSIGSWASTIVSRTVEGEDVAEEFVDLRARLRSKRLVEARYLEVLGAAKTVKDILEVERALAEVREEIDRLEGRLQFLDDHTTMATISIHLSEPAPPSVATAPSHWDRLFSAFDEGGAEGVKILGLLITYGIASLPVIGLTAIVVLFALRLRRLLGQ